jgi:hypothetical protein
MQKQGTAALLLREFLQPDLSVVHCPLKPNTTCPLHSLAPVPSLHSTVAGWPMITVAGGACITSCRCHACASREALLPGEIVPELHQLHTLFPAQMPEIACAVAACSNKCDQQTGSRKPICWAGQQAWRQPARCGWLRRDCAGGHIAAPSGHSASAPAQSRCRQRGPVSAGSAPAYLPCIARTAVH